MINDWFYMSIDQPNTFEILGNQKNAEKIM